MHSTPHSSGYDTSINVIGGLKDLSMIEHAYEYFFTHGGDQGSILPKDQFDLRTERTQLRVERGIRNGFLKFHDSAHQLLLQSLLSESLPLQDRNLVLFWQLCLNNWLFKEISDHVYVPVYWSGRTTLPKEEVIAFIKEIVHLNPELDWSEITIITLARKYLNFLTKLGFLEGAQKKYFTGISLSSEAVIAFLYFSRVADPSTRNLLKNTFLQLSMIPKDDLIARLKRLSMKEYFEMDYNGVDLNLSLTHEEQEVGHVLYH
ncbi:MAG: DUF1819 family protein [FCB group bacterium]|nr:DUF1819 family protein [FCB group bacterium]